MGEMENEGMQGQESQTSDSELRMGSDDEEDDDASDVLSESELEGEFAKLKEVWVAPREGTDMCIAEWLPEHCLAQIKHHRGSIMQKLGFMCRGRQYLTIEEALFLVDRGSMILVSSSDSSSRMYTRQECYQLLLDMGVQLDAFLTFAFLMRAGHLVRRFPCVLTHNEGRLVEVHRTWQNSWPDSAKVCKEQGIESDTDSSLAEDVRSSGAVDKEKAQCHPKIPRLESINKDSIPKVPQCRPSLAILSQETEFSRKGAAAIEAQVVVSITQEGELDTQLQQAASPKWKVLFAYCLGGDVVFIERRKTEVPVIWGLE